MKIRTFTGSSIQAALADARDTLGDEVLLLESAPADQTQPARVTVMLDSGAEPAPVLAAQPAGNRFGYSAFARPAAAPEPEETAAVSERFSTNSGDGYGASPAVRSGTGRGRLFADEETVQPPVREDSSTSRLEKILEAQLGVLHERLDRMERRLGDSVIGTSRQWNAHPLFASLLENGIRPATAARVFESMAAQEHQPDEDPELLRWLVAQELRRLLDIPAPKTNAGTIAFIGPSGAGKTTLLLKLARHNGFFGRRQSAVICILPADQDEPLYYDPETLFGRYDLAVFTVRTKEDLRRALHAASSMDQIFIDTPPLPLNGPAAHRALRRIKQLLEPVVPLEVHLVMNTTRALEGFNPQYLKSLPLAPDCLALTHLDETQGWGRIAEWIMTLGLPVRFAATGRSVPDGLVSFSPAWFIEEMMQL